MGLQAAPPGKTVAPLSTCCSRAPPSSWSRGWEAGGAGKVVSPALRVRWAVLPSLFSSLMEMLWHSGAIWLWCQPRLGVPPKFSPFQVPFIVSRSRELLAEKGAVASPSGFLLGDCDYGSRAASIWLVLSSAWGAAGKVPPGTFYCQYLWMEGRRTVTLVSG